MTKISVIIPIYNVSCYLKECLESIVNQSLKEIEIICIDDCSTDNSYEILLEYSNKDTRFKILKNNENMGVGYTRNLGQRSALSKYIFFMDPDDYISKDFLLNLYNTAEKYNSDIVHTSNCYYVTENNKYKVTNKKLVLKYDYECDINIDDIYEEQNNNFIYTSLWSKLFRLSFLVENNLFSPENKVGAAYDTILFLKSLLFNPKSSFNNRSVYYYRLRNDSITDKSKNNIDRINNIINNYKYILELYKNNYNLNQLLIFIISSISIYFFERSSFNFIRNNYSTLFDFINSIDINEKYLNKNSIFEKEQYDQYLCIKNNDNYYDYTIEKLSKKINYLETELSNLKFHNNWFRLFGINNSKNYLILIIFGFKISLKK